MIALIAPDRAAVEAVARAGRPALAWEVLRRDPAYRAAYRSLAATGEAVVAAETGFTADWGLHFR